MTAIEIATKVTAERQAVLFREKKGSPGQYDVKELFTGKSKGWTILDGYSASAVVAVHQGLNEVNRTKFETLSLTKMAAVAFKMLKNR